MASQDTIMPLVPADVLAQLEHARKALRAARDRAGLSQTELATEVGLSRSAISSLETGAYELNLLSFLLVAYKLEVPLLAAFPPHTGDLSRLIVHLLRRSPRLTTALLACLEAEAPYQSPSQVAVVPS